MSEFENKPEARTDSSFNDSIADDMEILQSNFQALQSLVSVVLILVLVISVCINIYFALETITMRQQYKTMANTANGFMTTGAPAVTDIYNRLTDLSAKHPDFKPIFARYQPFFQAHGIPQKK